MHGPSERKTILDLARRAIGHLLDTGAAIEPPPDPFLQVPCGAFVTLKIGGDLRGCIGFTEPKFPLGQTIVRCAGFAALNDSRFSPLQKQELERVVIDVSVLSEFREIKNVEEIVVGTHGLFVISALNRGLLLPQVAAEYGWDRETFLGHTCRKAGLPPDAWKSPGVKIEVFTAEVFGEDDVPPTPL
jgi:AmmeMemoRadiSam system protein A